MNARIPTALLLCLAALPLIGCDELFPQRSEGEKLYRKHCASCHGLDAKGNTPRYMSDANADLTDDNWDHGSGDDAMAYIIEYGVSGRMPANEDLTPQQRREIVAHLNTLITKAQSQY